ncbi:hypothetical protein [Bacillus sp. Marseille-Q1617]|uniref:hypothetical protein n=1 Tax=Bacillus sp. Marseille-Q1617 TaxID=2736887 RepID=UPI00158AEEFC|nr:hypothetical protein [Bacillus sp. Marseille-Q1617]
MMKDINMKVNPLYSDVDLSIQFHFEFTQGDTKIGEASASTYSIANDTYSRSQTNNVTYLKTKKCAVIDRFDVVNETEALCMKKLQHFLQVIGMKEIHSGYDIKGGHISGL